MLRQLFRAMVISRQGSAAEAILNHLSDSELADLGYTRDTFVEETKAQLVAELDLADKINTETIPVNANLVGAV